MMRCLAFAGGIWLNVAGALAQSPTAEREWLEAQRLDSLGKPKQAVRILDRLVSDGAYAYRARLMRSAIRYGDLETRPGAFEDLSEAMRLEPDSMAPYINRGSYYLKGGMTDRALADYQEALKRAHDGPDSVTAFLNIGAAHTQVRRFREAVEAYDRALAISPDDWASLSNKAATIDELGRADEARSIYLRLLEMKPEEIPILNNLGFLANGQGHYEEAMDWFERARKLVPDDPYVLNNLGYAQLMSARTDDALRNVQRSIKLMPSNSYAHRNLGLVLKARGEKDKACDAFEEALRLGFTKQYGPEVDDLRRQYCAP